MKCTLQLLFFLFVNIIPLLGNSHLGEEARRSAFPDYDRDFTELVEMIYGKGFLDKATIFL